MGISLLKKLLARDLSPFLDFEDVSSKIKLMIFICGERSCNANFKMGSAISVRREEGKKYAIQARKRIFEGIWKKQRSDDRIRTGDLSHRSRTP